MLEQVKPTIIQGLKEIRPSMPSQLLLALRLFLPFSFRSHYFTPTGLMLDTILPTPREYSPSDGHVGSYDDARRVCQHYAAGSGLGWRYL